MSWASKAKWITALAAVTACGASADALNTNVTVKGNAPAVCSLGGWAKDSGVGAFSPGTNAVITYSNSDLVDASANSVLGAGSAVVLRAPLLCNTAITWGLTTTKGALRLESSLVPPAGFSNQWLYNLTSGPRTSSGAAVGSLESLGSDGTPFSGESHSLSAPNSGRIAYFSMAFTPFAQATRMIAGTYSESVTLTVSPSL